MSVNACVVDGVRYVVQSRDERRTTQNSGICAPGPDGKMSYGQLQEILEFKYLSFKVALFRVKWFDTRNNGRVKKLTFRNGMTQIIGSGEWWKNDQYILATQVKQVFYLEDPAKPNVKVVEHVNHKKFFNRGVIVVENEPDIIHLDNSSDLPPSTSGNDLDNVTFYIDLHIDGESTEVDAPPDIIDVPGEDDDISDDEDPLPHDLADSDDEDLINVDDDGVDKMSADVAWSHGGDGGGEDRPPPHHVPSGCMGCFANRGKGKRKPNLGGRAAGRLNTRDKTQNLSLKEITDKKGPVPIRFELRDKQTLMPLGDHAAHWSSYIGEVIRGVPLYYPSWLKVPKERKAALITDIGTQFDLRPHMESPDWTEINAGIQQHLQKEYNTNKAAFKAQHRVIDPTIRTYNVEKIRRARPEDITTEEQRARSYLDRDPGRLLAFEMRWQSSATQEYPSLIDTFFVAYTVNGELLRDEDRRIYEEMRRLEATGTYTDDEINRLARRGDLVSRSRVLGLNKQRGHIPGVGRVLPARATAAQVCPRLKARSTAYTKSGSGGCGDDEESADDQEDEDEDGDGDMGPTVSLGIVAGEGIPVELSPANIPQRQVARERCNLVGAEALRVTTAALSVIKEAADMTTILVRGKDMVNSFLLQMIPYLFLDM
ncbi:zinc finger, CCHC-type containing protein [Tanacetum coccineum]